MADQYCLMESSYGNITGASKFNRAGPSYSGTPLLPRKNLYIKVDIANVSLQACKPDQVVKYIMETTLESGSAYQKTLREARAPHKSETAGFMARQ